MLHISAIGSTHASISAAAATLPLSVICCVTMEIWFIVSIKPVLLLSLRMLLFIYQHMMLGFCRRHIFHEDC